MQTEIKSVMIIDCMLVPGVLVKVIRARFRGFARPGQLIEAQVVLNEQVDQLFDFSATLRADAKIIMQNQFQLTNIPSSSLTGR